MTPTPDAAELSPQQFDRLSELLAEGGAAMNMEAVDGYFTALISGPVLVMPTDALSSVLGEHFELSDAVQVSELMALLFQHWNGVAAGLLRTLSEADHAHLPVVFEDEQGVAHGNDWAKGYMRAVFQVPGIWDALLNDDVASGALLPMMMLDHEHDPDPTLRSPPIDETQRNDLLAALAAGANRIYRYFEPHRRAGIDRVPNVPMRRSAAKVGRNEPCPCGSGRKFKQCCALAGT